MPGLNGCQTTDCRGSSWNSNRPIPPFMPPSGPLYGTANSCERDTAPDLRKASCLGLRSTKVLTARSHGFIPCRELTGSCLCVSYVRTLFLANTLPP